MGLKKTRHLMIDDKRNLNEIHGIPTEDLVCRTFQAGLKALKQRIRWTTLYLDHDLGDEAPDHTGYDVLCWLEQNPRHQPEQVMLITSNPVGRKKMEAALQSMGYQNKLGHIWMKEFGDQ